MTDDGTSPTEIVWNDSHESSPNNSKKPLKFQLPSPIKPQTIASSNRLSQIQSPPIYNNHSTIASVHEPSLPLGLPRVKSQHHKSTNSNKSNEIIHNIIIDDCDIPMVPPLTYINISQSTATTHITTSSCTFDEQIEDAHIMFNYSENTQHNSQPKMNQKQNNNNSNNTSNNNNNNQNGNNRNNNNKSNKDNGDDEKKGDDNKQVIQTQHKQYKLKKNISIEFFRYCPKKEYKIKISKVLTEDIIPNNVIENYIINVYDYVYKSAAMTLIDQNDFYSDFKILNCGFHNKLQQCLYFIAYKSKQKGYYNMKDILYTKQEILQELSMINGYHLPNPPKVYTDDMKEIDEAFNNPKQLCEDVIKSTKWHKVYVFNTMSNKQRLTFSITKTEFVDIIKNIICNGNNKVLLPIVMFTDNEYRTEYVQIVPLRKNIHIGVSYIYITNYGVKVTGIHLNKNCILNQHQLAMSIHHKCHCLDSFVSEIDCLHIGNPDDDKNRHNDLKKKHTILKKKHDQLEVDLDDMKNENINLQNKVAQLENDKQLLSKSISIINQQVPVPINIGAPSIPVQHDNTPHTRSTISTNTPKSQSHLSTPPYTPFSHFSQITPISNVRQMLNTPVNMNTNVNAQFPYHPMVFSNSLSSQSSNSTPHHNNVWHSQPNQANISNISRNNNYNTNIATSNQLMNANVQSQIHSQQRNISQQSVNNVVNNNSKGNWQ